MRAPPPIYCLQPAKDSVPVAAQEHMERNAGRLWNDFYENHEAKFFKDRHWLAREWPLLADGAFFSGGGGKSSGGGASSGGVVEVGCGVGNAALPLLDVVPGNVPVYACDFAPTAIEILKRSPKALASSGRLRAFVADASEPGALVSSSSLSTCSTSRKSNSPIEPHSLSAATLIFSLSAMSPAAMARAVENVRSVLKEDGEGRAFVRDYAAGDMASTRLAARGTPRRLHSWLGCTDRRKKESGTKGDDDGDDGDVEGNRKNLLGEAEAAAALVSGGDFFARGDGTRAFYFTERGLRRLFESRGFVTESIGTVHLVKENRASGERMPRRWVQAVFRLGAGGGGGRGGRSEGGRKLGTSAAAAAAEEEDKESKEATPRLEAARATATTTTRVTTMMADSDSDSEAEAEGSDEGEEGRDGKEKKRGDEQGRNGGGGVSNGKSSSARYSKYRPEWQDSESDDDDEGEEKEGEGGVKASGADGAKRQREKAGGDDGDDDGGSSSSSSSSSDGEATRAAARLFRTVLVDSTNASSSNSSSFSFSSSSSSSAAAAAAVTVGLESHSADVGAPLGVVEFCAAPSELRSTLAHTGLLTWPAAPALARVLLSLVETTEISSSPSPSFSPSSLLEVGAGASPLVALAAARSCANFRRVVSTDGSLRALRLLSSNVSRSAHLVVAERIRVAALPWGDDEAAREVVELANADAAAPSSSSSCSPSPSSSIKRNKKFDVVVGADTLYSPPALPRLMGTIAATLSDSNSTDSESPASSSSSSPPLALGGCPPLAVLCYQERRIRVAEAEAAAEAAGLAVVYPAPEPWLSAAERAGVGEGRLLRLMCLRHKDAEEKERQRVN